MEQRDPKIWKYVKNSKGYGGWRRRETLRAARKRHYKKMTTNPEYKDRRNRKAREYAEQNREKTRASMRATIARNKQRDKDANRISRLAVYSARDRARRMGLAFDLDFKKLLIPDMCPVLGIKLNDGSFDGKPTLDRLVPDQGYTMANTRIISMKANVLKGDATIEQLEKVIEYMRLNVACPGVGTAHSSQPPEPR